MASLSNGRITFYVNKTKKQIRVTRLNQKLQSAALNKIEAILSYRGSEDPLPDSINKWIEKQDRWLIESLAKTGLIEARIEDCSGADYFDRFIDKYNANRSDSWARNQRQAKMKFKKFFGDKLFREITPDDAQAFRDWMAKDCAQATVSGYIKTTKKIARAAVKDCLINASPFADVIAGSQANQSRLYFVDRESTQKLIDAAPNKQWRLLIALCRFGGLRNTSETFSLKSSHIDWIKKTIRVPGAKGKKAGVDAAEVRWREIPIYPELRPHLEDAFDPEQEFVIHGIEGTPSNTRGTLERIIAKAGLDQWPRVWHNLRASRDTELSEFLPDHVVGSLMGNTPKVSRKHYKMVTPQQMESLTLSPPLSPLGQKTQDQAEVETIVEMQPPETGEIEGKQSQLIRVFPGIYMNPEEFETEKRPRQDSNLRHQL